MKQEKEQGDLKHIILLVIIKTILRIIPFLTVALLVLSIVFFILFFILKKKKIELQYYTGLFYLKDEEDAAESYLKTRKVEIPKMLALGRKANEDEMERRRNQDDNKNKSEALKELQGYREKELLDKWLDESVVDLRIRLIDIPIDFKNNEHITIIFKYDVIKNNGTVKNIEFNCNYERTYEYVDNFLSFTAPENFGKEKQ